MCHDVEGGDVSVALGGISTTLGRFLDVKDALGGEEEHDNVLQQIFLTVMGAILLTSGL